MKFILSDTRERYRLTLFAMEPTRFSAIANDWENAKLGALFEDNDDRADFSVRDTLQPMLDEDRRTLEEAKWDALLAFASLDRTARSVVIEIHSAYTRSQPKE